MTLSHSFIATLLGALAAFGVSTLLASDPPTEFFQQHCFDCHDDNTTEGGIDLKTAQRDWTKPATSRHWEKVLAALEDGRMPPQDAAQPSESERHAATNSLHSLLRENVRVGGTVLRRLNRTEYENTIHDVLKVPFKTPPSFPADAQSHGFDNIGEGLILSPPLMQQYFEVATHVADLIIPAATTSDASAIEAETVVITPDDLSVNFEGSKVQRRGTAKVLRLVTKDEVLVRSCTWPTRFEARHSGRYQMTIRAEAFLARNDAPLKLRVLARKSVNNVFQSTKELRVLGELSIAPQRINGDLKLDIELQKGETPVFYWANATFGWDRNALDVADKQLREHLSDPNVYAAWLKMGEDRGRAPMAAWQQMKTLMNSTELDLEDERLKTLPPRFTATVRNELMWLFENMRHELGPALDIHFVTITGPTELIEDDEMRKQKQRTLAFLGERNDRSDQEYAKAILQPFLSSLFRRPVSDKQVDKYVRIAISHRTSGRRFEDGLHLSIRTALCSPNFLYRTTTAGPLDDFDRASRLSYFLWSAQPDAGLRKRAERGELSEAKVLEAETRRLLEHRRSEQFINNFAGQWLDLNLLPEIMPDPRLLAFNNKDLNAIQQETLLFIKEILQENHPIQTFVDPDFTYVNVRNAKLYGMKGIKGNDMRRVKLERGGRFGGILGQASVMMATANGVDTQPVLRGVWLLENVFGDAPPPPPSNVPAIEPDTSGANSIRDLLSRHRADASCAQCHNKIDPLGFALENFDPVGRWRTHYPIYEKQDDGSVKRRDGLPVDTVGELPDGTQIKDVVDLKQHLVRNIDSFSRCLAEKLLIYATGRQLNYADRLVVDQIVEDVRDNGNGFQDLIIAVVQSESFLTK